MYTIFSQHFYNKYLFFNIMLKWKIVRASKVSVLYIYILIIEIRVKHIK